MIDLSDAEIEICIVISTLSRKPYRTAPCRSDSTFYGSLRCAPGHYRMRTLCALLYGAAHSHQDLSMPVSQHDTCFKE